jgi:[ribosomal protein S18]-alanine N-acetyltransferase
MTRGDRNVRLRDMTEADLATVVGIEQQIQGHPWTRGMFADSLAQGYMCKVLELAEATLTAGVKEAGGEPETAGRIAGYAILMPALDEVHLLNIGIARALQCKGLGEKLLNIIIMLSKEQKFVRMLLEVRLSNAPALALYRKAGFTEIGIRRDYYPAGLEREDAIVMERWLQ